MGNTDNEFDDQHLLDGDDDKLPEPVADPGENEGKAGAEEPAQRTTPQQKVHEPSENHPRFKAVYKQLKDSQRELEDLKAKNQDFGVAFETLKTHNAELAKTLKGMQESGAQRTVDDNMKNLETLQVSLKSQRAAAVEADDMKKVLDIQDQLDEINLKIFQAKSAPAKKEEGPTVDEQVAKALTQKDIQAAQAAIFSEKDWLNPSHKDYDPIMAGAAKTVDELLAKDPVWSKKPLVEQFREVAKRVEERFGIKQEQKRTPEPRRQPAGSRLPGVASVDVSGGHAGVDVTTLSAEERKVARNMFAGHEDPERAYAEQKALIAKGRK